jgi:mannose-6-phosphate isomerase-like protein (cupin superfamily)
VAYPAATYEFLRQMVWVQSGRLTFVEGAVAHDLGPGDCLSLGPPEDCVFRNEGPEPCRYVVAIARR